MSVRGMFGCIHGTCVMNFIAVISRLIRFAGVPCSFMLMARCSLAYTAKLGARSSSINTHSNKAVNDN